MSFIQSSVISISIIFILIAIIIVSYLYSKRSERKYMRELIKNISPIFTNKSNSKYIKSKINKIIRNNIESVNSISYKPIESDSVDDYMIKSQIFDIVKKFYISFVTNNFKLDMNLILNECVENKLFIYKEIGNAFRTEHIVESISDLRNRIDYYMRTIINSCVDNLIEDCSSLKDIEINTLLYMSIFKYDKIPYIRAAIIERYFKQKLNLNISFNEFLDIAHKNFSNFDKK